MIVFHDEYEKFANHILSLRKEIRFVGIMGPDGEILHEERQKKISLKNRERDVFEVDQHLIRNIQEVFDDYLGRVKTMFIVREKIKQLVFYKDRKIIFVSCDPKIENKILFDLCQSVSSMLK